MRGIRFFFLATSVVAASGSIFWGEVVKAAPACQFLFIESQVTARDTNQPAIESQSVSENQPQTRNVKITQQHWNALTQFHEDIGALQAAKTNREANQAMRNFVVTINELFGLVVQTNLVVITQHQNIPPDALQMLRDSIQVSIQNLIQSGNVPQEALSTMLGIRLRGMLAVQHSASPIGYIWPEAAAAAAQVEVKNSSEQTLWYGRENLIEESAEMLAERLAQRIPMGFQNPSGSSSAASDSSDESHRIPMGFDVVDRGPEPDVNYELGIKINYQLGIFEIHNPAPQQMPVPVRD